MSEEIKIEKGIPITSPRKKKDHPWTKLEIGDSFLVERHIQSVRGSVSTANQTTMMRFTVREWDENHCRVWRIA